MQDKYLTDIYVCIDYTPEGGRVLGGGGFFIPRRNSSPVSLRFRFTGIRCWVGWGEEFVPPGRVHRGIAQPMEIEQGVAGLTLQRGFHYHLTNRDDRIAFQQP